MIRLQSIKEKFIILGNYSLEEDYDEEKAKEMASGLIINVNEGKEAVKEIFNQFENEMNEIIEELNKGGFDKVAKIKGRILVRTYPFAQIITEKYEDAASTFFHKIKALK